MAKQDDGEHNFNRRKSDANVLALAVRVGSVERRVEVLEQENTAHRRELEANTKLTSQLHEAVYGRDEDPGLNAKVGEMHEVFTTASKGFEYIGKAGRLAERAIKRGGRLARPMLYIAALGAGAWVWWKTGDFKLPDWLPK